MAILSVAAGQSSYSSMKEPPPPYSRCAKRIFGKKVAKIFPPKKKFSVFSEISLKSTLGGGRGGWISRIFPVCDLRGLKDLGEK